MARARLLPWLLAQILRHSQLVRRCLSSSPKALPPPCSSAPNPPPPFPYNVPCASALCYLAGLGALAMLPTMTHHSYTREPALTVGNIGPRFGSVDAAAAVRARAALLARLEASSGGGAGEGGLPAPQAYLLHELAAAGLDAQPFRFHSRRGLLQGAPRRECVSVVSVARAPRGDGKEGVALVTPLRPSADLPSDMPWGPAFMRRRGSSKRRAQTLAAEAAEAAAGATGLTLALMGHLSHTGSAWMAKCARLP